MTSEDVTVDLSVERAAVRSVPPIEMIRIDEWRVALGRGHVSRLNSVTTFGTVPEELFDAVRQVEHRYRGRGRPVRFRLTMMDPELESLLSARGYERTGEVVVMTGGVQGEPDPQIGIRTAVTPSWLEALEAFAGISPSRAAELGESLAGLELPHAVACLEGAAVGAVVIDGSHAGIFDVAVHPDQRRSGAASRLTSALLAWAADHGAGRSYLQVTAENEPALALYESIDFSEAYRYWYRDRV